MKVCMRWGMTLLLTATMVLPSVRAQSADEELQRAATAIEQRNEAEAWQLFLQHRARFNQAWADLDWRFVAWVADQLRRQQEFSDALEVCARVLQREQDINPELAAAVLMVRGDVFRDQQNYAAARLEYEGVDRHPQYRQTEYGRHARFRLLDIMRLTREYDGALQRIERLKDVRDVVIQAEAYYHHAHIAFDRGDYELAREMLSDVKARRPEHVEAVFLEGELNLIQNRLQDPELEIGQRRLQTFVIPGRPIVIRMQDPNLAVARGGAGIPILLRTSVGQDRETILLMPSPRDPTLFRGSIRTLLGPAEPGNMALELLGDDDVIYNIDPEFQRANELAYEDKVMTVVADGELTISSGAFIDQAERDARALQQRIARAQADQNEETEYAFERVRDVNTVRPGNPIYMQVRDLDRSVSTSPDQVTVSVRASSGAMVAAFPLAETEPHSGVFRGALPTTVSPPRARASDSAPGSDPGAVIDTRRADEFWRSAPGGEQPAWLEVDLMRSVPVQSAELFLDPASGVRSARLMAATLGELVPVCDTTPPRQTRYGFLDLEDQFGEQRNTAAYIYTEVTSPRAQEAALKIGSADGVQCWVNGQSVHRSLRGRTWNPEEDVVTVNLREGVNGIVLRINQISGTWGASLSVVDARGESLTDSASYPALAPGVVTRWHVFDYATTTAIEIPERVTVGRAVRVGDQSIRWVPRSVAPEASLVLAGDRLRTVFHGDGGWRRLRWVFDERTGPSVGVREVRVRDRFDQRLVPGEFAVTETDDGGMPEALAIGPGDTIDVVYFDEKRTREDDGMLRQRMRSGYHNAQVSLEYETITMDARGERQIRYHRAVRYRPGHTDTLVVRVVDYDEDTTAERDRIPVRISTTSGETLELNALETGPHTGEFLATLRLGDATDPRRETLAVQVGDDIRLRYYDMENSDGVLERTAQVRDAGDDPPELRLFQTAILQDTEGLLGERGEIREETRLPRGDPQARGEPVVTSLEAPLHFQVRYPMAALHDDAVFPARLMTASEKAAAAAENREPRYVEVRMQLTDIEEAMFEATVPLRLGEATAEAATELDTRRRTVLPVRGLDEVIVEVVSLNPGTVTRARFRLASDARLDFTDRRYDEPAEAVHAGDFLHLRVVDPDRSVSNALDSITVTLNSQVDAHTLTLVETLPDAGVFTGRIKTELAGDPRAADAPPDADTDADTPVLRVAYGESVRAVYRDQVSVVSPATPREVIASIAIHRGDDGTVSSFTRLFRDDDMAVRTRLLTAEALFEMAKEHRRGDLEEVAEEQMLEGKELLEEAIVNFPGSPFAAQAEFLLANLAQEVEAFEQALERYNRVLAVWPDSEYAPRALLRKAQTLEAIGDHVNAADTYVELTYTYPDSALVADAVVRLGQHFYRREEYPVAARVFANFERNHPEHELAARALFLAAQSNMKGAEERFQRLEHDRYDAQSREWLGEAVTLFERLIDTYDGERDLRAESMYWTGDIYVKLGNMRSAYQVFTRLRWDYPESNWARFARGRLTDAAFQRIEREM